MKTILITGINGFLGSYIAKGFSKKYRVIGLENKIDNLNRLKQCDFKIYFYERKNLDSIFAENSIDIIIHAATFYSRANEGIEDLIETNIRMPLMLYELSVKYKVSLFVNTDTFFNSQNISYDYLGAYTLSKRHLVDWLKQIKSNTKVINMKLFHIYGPNDSPQKFVTKIISDLINNIPEIELTYGEQKRDFIFIDDVVEAYNFVLNSHCKINVSYMEYEVGTGISYSIREFVTVAANVTESKSELKFGALSYRNGEIMDSIANNVDLLGLGWVSKFDIRSGIYELYKYEKERIDFSRKND